MLAGGSLGTHPLATTFDAPAAPLPTPGGGGAAALLLLRIASFLLALMLA